MVMKGFTELVFPLMIAFLIAFCLIESLYPYYESYTAWNRYGIYENVSRHLSRTSLFGNTLSLAGISILIFLLSVTIRYEIFWSIKYGNLLFSNRA